MCLLATDGAHSSFLPARWWSPDPGGGNRGKRDARRRWKPENGTVRGEETRLRAVFRGRRTADRTSRLLQPTDRATKRSYVVRTCVRKYAPKSRAVATSGRNKRCYGALLPRATTTTTTTAGTTLVYPALPSIRPGVPTSERTSDREKRKE